MRKHRNKTQNGLLVEFMKENSDIAQDDGKRDKFEVESLWRELADALNAAGPPHKDVGQWKKVWTDLKCDIKKKLARNMIEAHASGGRPYSKLHLTQTEQSLVRIFVTKMAVENNSGAELSVSNDSNVCIRNDNMPTKSYKQRPSYPTRCSAIKRPRTNTGYFKRIQRALEEGNESMANAVEEHLSVSCRMLKILQQRNEIKKQQLKLELMQFEIQNKNVK